MRPSPVYQAETVLCLPLCVIGHLQMREGTPWCSAVCLAPPVLGLAFSTVFVIFPIFSLIQGLAPFGLGYSSGPGFVMCLLGYFVKLDFYCGECSVEVL